MRPSGALGDCVVVRSRCSGSGFGRGYAAQLIRSIERDTNPPATVPLSLANDDTGRRVYRTGA
ncbi:MAG: hypothetical protein QOG95_503 [Mycobacterium sp.]|jgi:hypothetical protein|nr:hypothetical protein [Mycobacterium sp.]